MHCYCLRQQIYYLQFDAITIVFLPPHFILHFFFLTCLLHSTDEEFSSRDVSFTILINYLMHLINYNFQSKYCFIQIKWLIYKILLLVYNFNSKNCVNFNFWSNHFNIVGINWMNLETLLAHLVTFSLFFNFYFLNKWSFS